MSGELTTCKECNDVLFYDDEKVYIKRDTEGLAFVVMTDPLAEIYCNSCAEFLLDDHEEVGY
jgi:RNase P subunit RPR2